MVLGKATQCSGELQAFSKGMNGPKSGATSPTKPRQKLSFNAQTDAGERVQVRFNRCAEMLLDCRRLISVEPLVACKGVNYWHDDGKCYMFKNGAMDFVEGRNDRWVDTAVKGTCEEQAPQFALGESRSF